MIEGCSYPLERDKAHLSAIHSWLSVCFNHYLGKLVHSSSGATTVSCMSQKFGHDLLSFSCCRKKRGGGKKGHCHWFERQQLFLLSDVRCDTNLTTRYPILGSLSQEVLTLWLEGEWKSVCFVLCKSGKSYLFPKAKFQLLGNFNVKAEIYMTFWQFQDILTARLKLEDHWLDVGDSSGN